MRQQTIYVLHKNGADGHYNALEHLLDKEHISIKYREFSIVSNFFKSIVKLNLNLFKKQCVNTLFLLYLLISKGKKIVLGIAPFDSKLTRLKSLLKHHKIFYHTSWACWDGTFHPKSKHNTPKVKQYWKDFLEKDVAHIFAVTHKSKTQLTENFEINSEKISVVYHSLNNSFFRSSHHIDKKPSSFIYLGRMLPQKGIPELITFFSKQENAELTLVGNGPCTADMTQLKNSNIRHIDFIKNKEELIDLIAEHEYLVLFSKKTSKWEELFGMVIIECMAQGTIPIATNHTGPKEIITEDVGYLCEEHEILKVLDQKIKTGTFDIERSEKAKNVAKSYHVETISNYWKAILN